MKIYVGHSGGFDYKQELYQPIRASHLNDLHTFLLPHEKSLELFSSPEFFRTKQVDLFLAEVSFPSTGLGIELGQAMIYGIPIVCIYKEGHKYSSSITVVTDKIISYKEEFLMPTIESIINNFIMNK